MPGLDEMREIARKMARANRAADPGIKKVLWFPDENELRLVEIGEDAFSNEEVTPYHFGPVPAEGIPVPSGIAMVRPEEEGKIRLPEDWGDWNDGKEL